MELSTVVVGCVVAIGLIIAFGIPPLIARATTPATAAEATAGLVRSLSLFASLYLLVPTVGKIFGDFGAELSFLTASIFEASSTAETVSLPILLLLLGGETLAFYLLFRHHDRRRQARWLSIVTTLASAVAVILIAVALAVPLFELLHQLQ